MGDLRQGSFYTAMAWALRAVLVLAFGQQALTGDWVGALAMALFLVLSFGYLLREEQLPNVFDGLTALAALLNAAGFVSDLYQRVPLYDEVAHAITIFAVTLAFFCPAYRDEAPAHRARVGLAVFSFGVTVGSLWEIVEWLTGRLLSTEVIFGLSDAITDLMANSVGALLAAAVVLRRRERGGRANAVHQPDRGAGTG